MFDIIEYVLCRQKLRDIFALFLYKERIAFFSLSFFVYHNQLCSFAKFFVVFTLDGKLFQTCGNNVVPDKVLIRLRFYDILRHAVLYKNGCRNKVTVVV